MAHFTTEEANACTINGNTRKMLKDGVFQYWVMSVNDADGNYYDWKDRDTAEGASDTEIKTAIRDYLTTNCSKKPLPPVFSSVIATSLSGSTVG